MNSSDYTTILSYLIDLDMEVDNVLEGNIYNNYTPLAIICGNYYYNRANVNYSRLSITKT